MYLLAFVFQTLLQNPFHLHENKQANGEKREISLLLHNSLMKTNMSLRLRFTTGHIWACPPSEGDDYIFHCHPVDQKIPKPKRLQEWYKKMLDKAVAERIVHDYKVRHAFYLVIVPAL